ncbi:MAG: hypothetical protein KF861_18480 [Planctomycetaceae bacterium]|nr:hypothetical protein [Planctomycetaceae bacterium]
MSRKLRVPKYGKHKGTGQARVLIDGEHHYLGPYDSAESKRRYKELVDRWQQRQQARLFPSMTLGQLALLHMEHAATYYQKDGRPTSEVASIRTALKPLLQGYRAEDVADFGPVKLKAYRNRLVGTGLSRYSVNKYVGRVVRMVRWAVSEEYCAPTVLTALESVQGLQKGRTKARESEGVKPVDPDHVAALVS